MVPKHQKREGWSEDECKLIIQHLEEANWKRLRSGQASALRVQLEQYFNKGRSASAIQKQTSIIRKTFGPNETAVTTESSKRTSGASLIARLGAEIKSFVESHTEEVNNLKIEIQELKQQLRNLAEVRTAVEQYQQKVLGKKVLRIT